MKRTVDEVYVRFVFEANKHLLTKIELYSIVYS